MKIAIIGNSGSGKSTLAFKLSKILNIPLYHLDQYYWLPEWQEPNYYEFEQMHNQLCDQEEWIIEGMNTRILEYRFFSADVIIFLDIPTYVCLFRVVKRAIIDFGKVRSSSAKECPERIPDLKFLKFILSFNKQRKHKIGFLLECYKGQRHIFVIKNEMDKIELLTKLEKLEL